MHLVDFNNAPNAEAKSAALFWAHIDAFAETVVASRPFASLRDLEALVTALASSWTDGDLDAALSAHPRIGERAATDDAAAAASRREQAAVAIADTDVTARIAAANAHYEARFRRVFLIRAKGRTPVEIAAEAERRLTNDERAEVEEATQQLAEIAALRLADTFADDPEIADPAPREAAPQSSARATGQ